MHSSSGQPELDFGGPGHRVASFDRRLAMIALHLLLPGPRVVRTAQRDTPYRNSRSTSPAGQ